VFVIRKNIYNDGKSHHYTQIHILMMVKTNINYNTELMFCEVLIKYSVMLENVFRGTKKYVIRL